MIIAPDPLARLPLQNRPAKDAPIVANIRKPMVETATGQPACISHMKTHDRARFAARPAETAEERSRRQEQGHQHRGSERGRKRPVASNPRQTPGRPIRNAQNAATPAAISLIFAGIGAGCSLSANRGTGPSIHVGGHSHRPFRLHGGFQRTTDSERVDAGVSESRNCRSKREHLRGARALK